MRATRILNDDLKLVNRFLAILGRGLVIASRSKSARPGFFIVAARLIGGYLEPVYLAKEGVLLQALEDCGFPSDSGPVGSMLSEQRNSREISATLAEAARAWQGGNEGAKAEVVWAASEYTDLMRQHFERLHNLINPLMEQSLTAEGELKIAQDLNRIQFADREVVGPEQLEKDLKMLEEEVKDWES